MGTHKYMTAPLPMETMPRGVPYIVGNEFAERFSFYGMKGILVVFMTQYLMRSSGELDLMSNEDATGYYHLFTSAVYFTPLLGALIADIFLGKYMTIISLSLVYCLGHFMLALDDTRFGLALGLGLIALGAGGIKPCVSAHVGDQFGSGNKHMLPKVYGWFYISINIGAFISNLLTPWLLNSPDFGPQWAFGVPGGLMLLATWVFWLGRRKFIHIQPSGLGFVKETLSGDGLVAIGKLSIIFVFVAMFWALFDQTGSTWVIQARSMDRTIWGYTLFEAQFQAANPLLILILVPIFTVVVYPAINTLIRLTPVRKIAIGMFLTVVAFTVPALIETNIAGGRVFEASSQAARRTADGDWSAWNLIDGDPDGSGWATAGITRDKESGEDQVSGDEGGLGTVVIQLRERRAWTISGLAVNPFVRGVMNADDDAGEDDTAFADTDRFAKDITIFISDRPAGPWSEVATIALEQTDEFQTVTFGPVEASYVKLRIDANWGGNHAAIGRVRVIAAAEFPPRGCRRNGGVGLAGRRRHRVQATHHLAVARLYPHHRRRGHDLDHLPRVLVHPGAAKDEVVHHVVLLVVGLGRQPHRRRRELLHPQRRWHVEAGRRIVLLVLHRVDACHGGHLPGRREAVPREDLYPAGRAGR